MIFWLTGSGFTSNYPRQLIPWHVKPRSMAATYMVDSGVTKDPPSIEHLVDIQAKVAEIAVSPDILGDAKATIEKTEAWLPLIKRAAPHVITVVCTQGSLAERADIIKHFKGRVDVFGAGLAFKRKHIKWTPAERKDIITKITPLAHEHGARFHVFGTGCTGGILNAMLEAGVDSFDSSSPLMAAAMCRIYDKNLRQVAIGGDTSNVGKTLRLAINLNQLENVIQKGVGDLGIYDWLDRSLECSGLLDSKEGKLTVSLGAWLGRYLEAKVER